MHLLHLYASMVITCNNRIPVSRPHSPHYRLDKSSNGQKFTMNSDGYSNQGF